MNLELHIVSNIMFYEKNYVYLPRIKGNWFTNPLHQQIIQAMQFLYLQNQPFGLYEIVNHIGQEKAYEVSMILNSVMGTGEIEPHIKHMLTLEVPSGDLLIRIKTLINLRVSLIRTYGPLVDAVDQLSSNWAMAKEVLRERDRVLEVQFQRWFSDERTKMNEDRFTAIGIFLSYNSLRRLHFALGSRTEQVVTTLVSEMFAAKSR